MKKTIMALVVLLTAACMSAPKGNQSNEGNTCRTLKNTCGTLQGDDLIKCYIDTAENGNA